MLRFHQNIVWIIIIGVGIGCLAGVLVMGWAFEAFPRNSMELFVIMFGAMPCGGIIGLCCAVMLSVRRRKLHECLKCGYDLRASNERCPECGEAIG